MKTLILLSIVLITVSAIGLSQGFVQVSIGNLVSLSESKVVLTDEAFVIHKATVFLDAQAKSISITAFEQGELVNVTTEIGSNIALMVMKGGVSIREGGFATLPRNPNTSRTAVKRTQDLELPFDKGLQLEKEGKYDQAILAYQKAMEIDPNQPTVAAHIAFSLAKNGQKDEALKAYERAISLEPDEAAYRTNMGILLAEMGKSHEAQEEFKKAAVQDPTSAAQNYYNLGAILVNGKRFSEAAEAFRQSIDANKLFSESYYQLALCLLDDINKSQQAMSLLKEYVKIGQNRNQVEIARKLIQLLQGKK